MDIIKSGADISVLFSEGRRFHTAGLTIIVLPTGDRSPIRSGRVAFVAGKKTGKAVWRNSAKRRMRALCREAGGPWAERDVLFLAKRPLMDESYAQAKTELATAIRRAALDRPLTAGKPAAKDVRPAVPAAEGDGNCG